MAEQIVAGADEEGDVLAILGTTLIVWAVLPDLVADSPFYSVPHTAPGGKWLFGGPSNAGGLFLGWASRFSPATTPTTRAWRRTTSRYGSRTRAANGCRSTTRTRRAELVDLDLTHGPHAIRRAAFEASGFVTRRIIEAAPVPARRIVATGGGTRVAGWVEALADTTGLPVHVAAVPEGGALGAAFLARMAAGLETNMADAARWARTERIVEPDPAWLEHTNERFARFSVIAG